MLFAKEMLHANFTHFLCVGCDSWIKFSAPLVASASRFESEGVHVLEANLFHSPYDEL